MRKQLGLIAFGGICVGIASFAVVAATQAGDLLDVLENLNSNHPACEPQNPGGVVASERRWNWDGADKVDIAIPASVRYRGGEGEEVIARGDPALLAHVTVHDGRISIDCRLGRKHSDLEIVLPGRTFQQVSLLGSGNVVMENINQPDLTLRIAGSGTLRAQGQADRMEVSITGSGEAFVTEFTAKTFEVKVAGSGSLKAQGSADKATISIAGSGDADLGALAIKSLEVKVAGSGNAEAAPTEEADIKIMGSGDVRLLTHPTRLSTKVMGSGRLIQSPAGDRS